MTNVWKTVPQAYSCLPATVLASCVESVWCCGGGGGGGQQTQLSRALWLWCGALGARVWLPLLPRDASRRPDSSRHTFMAKRIMLPFHLNIYPLTILFDDAILLGAENDTTLYASDSNSVFSLPFCVVNRTSQVYLHQILRQLLRRNLGYHAWEIARSCAQLPYFPHSLELLLHEVLEEEATSKEPIPDAQLPSVIEFVHEFPVYLQTVVQCARKTEIALWAYLFSAAGKPKELFQECLQRKMLDTAASYLIILQNLESSTVSRQLATQLLDTALQQERWDLARDLVRFLRAIDPNDVDSPRNSVNVQAKYGQIVQPQPNAEDLSVILGSMQLAGARGRSFSTTAAPREPSPPAAATAPPPARRTAAVKRKKSVPARADRESYSGTAEEFFIDMMIQRHARLLLSTARLMALGKLAAALDLHLVAWLAGERERAARVDNAVLCLKRLHEDFAWPYPVLQQGEEHYIQRKASVVPSGYSVAGEGDSLCGDSGYVSLSLRAALPLAPASPDQPRPPAPPSSAGECSVAEGGCAAWGGVGEAAGGAGEERRYAALMERLPLHQAERGDHTSHVRLRYFLQLMTEASCVEWALVVAVALRDALAVLRTTNAARGHDVSLGAVRRLRAAVLQLCAWSDAEWYVCVQPARCSCAPGAMPSGTCVCSLRAAAVRLERCRVVRVCAACALQLCAWSDAEWYVCVQPARCSCAPGAMPSGTCVCSLRAAALRVERCRVVRVCAACALQLCAWSDAEWYVCGQPAHCSCAPRAMPSGTCVCSLRAAAVRLERCRVVRVRAACALQLCAWSDAEWYVCVQPARCSCARGAMPSGTCVCSLRAAAVRLERCRVVRVCAACALQLCAWSDAEWYVCVQPARCSCARGAMPSGTCVGSLRAAAVRLERCRVVRVCVACALQLCAWSDAEWYVCVQPARCSCARGAMPSGTGVCSLRAAAVRVERCRVVRVCVACALQLCAWSDAEWYVCV
ncbi:unnamed protein product [Parnassius apollo]|uniref:Protein RIC1 homolog n=1 Tax=Parnassius apollo TaxID=110799 RepID=A0A8S3XPG4_PARAO|nr:unnamed protein product [Parnassius apollo]